VTCRQSSPASPQNLTDERGLFKIKSTNTHTDKEFIKASDCAKVTVAQQS
jgi:hypothetical protein